MRRRRSWSTSRRRSGRQPNLHPKRVVASRAVWSPGRVDSPDTLFVVRRRGDRQYGADRLDPVAFPILVDERHHHFGRRSSSACAKYADALRKISFARFRSRFSRPSSFNLSRSPVVRPGRLPLSRSACLTHLRRVSAVQPILLAIELIAAHWDSCSLWCSKHGALNNCA